MSDEEIIVEEAELEGGAGERKRVSIQLSEQFYNRLKIIAEERNFGRVGKLIAFILRDWYAKEMWNEANNTLNLEHKIEMAVAGRLNAWLEDILNNVKVILNILENQGYAVEKEGDMDRLFEKEEDYPDATGDFMGSRPSDIVNDIRSTEVGSHGEFVPKDEVEKYNEEVEAYEKMREQTTTNFANRYGNGRFGDVKGRAAPPGVAEKYGAKVEEMKEQKEYPSPGGSAEKEKPREERRSFRSSKINMEKGYPIIEGLKIKRQVGAGFVMYEDGSIWKNGRWFKKGKKLIEILKEEEEL